MISKGKSKIEEESTRTRIEMEVESEAAACCGICLSEAGSCGVSRGYIDSCDHYFCFICIMEWAKVESKCPLCKTRFSTICRPAKPPVFATERVVNVPVRDQVHHYFGNSTIGPPDPYSEIKCTLCHIDVDENLMLLCDLCDSAAHTYCIGLGATVPEGEWFCQDCTLLKDELVKSEISMETGIQIMPNTIDTRSLTCEHVSASDIVGEPPVHAVLRSRSNPTDSCHLPPTFCSSDQTIMTNIIETDMGTSLRVSFDTDQIISPGEEHASIFDIVQEPPVHAVHKSRNFFADSCHLQPSSSTIDETVMANAVHRPSLASLTTAAQHPSTQNTRTLQNCRDLNFRICAMRENWNSFQSGILGFSSGGRHGKNSGQTSNACSSGRQSASTMKHQSAAQSVSLNLKAGNEEHEIQRAWEMMNKAKSLKMGHERSNMHQEQKHPILKQNGQKNVHFMRYRDPSPDNKRSGLKSVARIGSGHHYYHSLDKGCHKQVPFSGDKRLGRPMSGDAIGFDSITGHFPQQGSKASEFYTNLSCVQNSIVRSEKQLGEKSLVGPAYVISSFGSGSPSLNADHVRGVNDFSASKGKGKLEKMRVGGQQYDDAKREIQSLVKLDLKLQTKEDKLEVDTFKEVARLATHSILAACGLEHPRSGSCSIPGFMCSHLGDVSLLLKSTPMPNACRDCFYSFVKDMVNAAVLQKKAAGRKVEFLNKSYNCK